MSFELTNQSNEISNSAETQKAIAHAQAQTMIAMRMPRDRSQVLLAIEAECSDTYLAEAASYSYRRGGQTVEGPSIQLAQTLASCYGHVEYGHEILSINSDQVLCRAHARDVQKNVTVFEDFIVSLVRTKKLRNGEKISTKLEDPRDIKETINSWASRAKRECILRVIPRHYTQRALDFCNATLHADVSLTSEKIKALLNAFKEHGVTRAMLESRIQRKMETITPANFISLRKIYKSIQDGMGTVEDFFEVREDRPKDLASLVLPKESKESKESEVSKEVVL